MGQTLILSDVHFGAKESNLSTHFDGKKVTNIAARKKNVDKFINAISAFSDLEEIIFLGDIFDFQLSNFSSSLEASEYFFSCLEQSNLNKNICYVPGNHDHTIWLQHVYKDQFSEKCISREKITADFKFTQYDFKNDDSFVFTAFRNPENFAIRYPFVRRTINNKKYLFTHGHFLDTKQRIYEKIFKSLFPLMDGDLKPSKNIDQLEILSCSLYEMFTIVGQTKKGRDFMSSSMELFSAFSREKIAVDKFKKDILTFLKDYCGQWENESNNVCDVLDYFVFGHTHFADVNSESFRKQGNLIVMNTGSWVNNHNIGEYILIDSNKKHPEIFILETNRKLPVLHNRSQYLNLDAIPREPLWRKLLCKKKK